MTEFLGITGSSAYDVAACVGRGVLPQADCRREVADRGNVMHAFSRGCIVYPEKREQFLADIKNDEWRATCSKIDFESLTAGLEIKHVEVAYALDVLNRACRFIGVDIERKYNETLLAKGQEPLKWHEIPFSIDVEAYSQDAKCPVEVDLKTGWSIGEVSEHGQRKIHTAGLMLFHGTDAAIGRVAYLREDGTVDHDGHEFSIFDAFETCDELLAMLKAVRKAREEYASGIIPRVVADRERQCRYCQSFSFCPYWTNLVRAAGDRLKELPDVEEIKPEEAGPIYDYIKDVLKVAEEVEEKLRERALRERLPVDSMWEYSAKDQKGRAYEDTAALRGALLQHALRGGEPMSEEEASELMASFRKQGKDITVVKKRKRLDIVQDNKLKKVG